jgi:hypothetical protein
MVFTLGVPSMLAPVELKVPLNERPCGMMAVG